MMKPVPMISEMSEDQLNSATDKEIAAAIAYRLEYDEYLLWMDLDAVNDIRPGLGIEHKSLVTDALEQMAWKFRTRSLGMWKKV
jgi:hypothetical protein